MNLGTLIGMVGAGVGGYTQGKRQRERDEQDKAERETRQELLKMQVKREKQAQADDDALRAAGADVAPVAQTLEPVGQPAEMGPNTPTTAYQVGDKTTWNANDAQRLATEQNAPAARVERQATALQKMGKPGAAATLQTQQLQLDDAHRKHLDTMFDRSLSGLSTPDEIAALVSESANDGMGGNLKIKAVPSPDGKKIAYHRLAPDGTTAPTGLEFDNSAKGLADSKLWLSRNTSISDKVGHLRSEAQMKAQAEDRKADNDRADRQLSIMDRHYRAMEGVAETKAGNAVERMSEADKLQLAAINKDADRIQTAITKAQAEGSWDPSSSNGKDLTTQLAGLQMRAADITARYGKPGAAADPLGLRSGSSGTQVSPAEQSSRDQDRVATLKAELEKAEATGNRADADAVRAELKRMGFYSAPGAPAQPRQQLVRMQPAQAAQVAPAPAAPTTASILAEPIKGNALLEQLAADKAAGIDKAIEVFKVAQAQFQGAARSQDPKAIAHYQKPLQAAQAALDNLLKDVPEQQRKAILAQTSN